MRIWPLIALTMALLIACGQAEEGESASLSTTTSKVTTPTTAQSSGESATVPQGDLVFDSNRSGNFEVYAMAEDGSNVRQITHDERFDSWWPRLSPDRSQILFYRTPAGEHESYQQTSLWMIGVADEEPREIRERGADDWQVQGHAEWSPDGAELVMFGGNRINPQIFVTDAHGGNPRQVTDRGGQNLDPSWSPDGQDIYFVGCPRAVCFASDYEIYVIPEAGGEATRLTEDGFRDHDPYLSPDGASLAWLTMSSNEPPVGTWGIRVAGADGSNPRWLIDDGQVNSYPAWSSDGQLIYFHRLEPGTDETFGIFAIDPDGEGLRELTAGQPGVNEYPDAGTP